MADLVHDLARWAAESRERDAAASRSRKRWLDQQAAEEATFAALLLSLGEFGDKVRIRLCKRLA